MELLYRDIIRKLDGMRMGAETERQRSLEEMTDYYTMWAHQIKTPIFALRLLLREEPEENRESGAQLFRIEQYVEMALQYQRLKSTENDLLLTSCPLDQVVRNTVKSLAPLFIARNLSLEIENISVSVLTDEKWLTFVVEQLLSNALKYTPPGGRITLYLEADKTLVVEDNGIGIPKEAQTSVFERFYRVDKSRSKATGGTGLGLAIVKHIARIHNARIKLESQVDVGTTITVTFPTAS